MRRISFLLIVTILLAGCTGSSFTPTPTLPATAETPSSLPEPTDPTQLITVVTGDTFNLVLPANPSTGYRWNLMVEPDANLIEFVEQNFIPEQPVVPGSGGVDVWTFRGVNAGDTTIELGYYPPSNSNEPDETVVFSIHVK